MSEYQQPSAHNIAPANSELEQQAREALLSHFVDEAAGSVGMFTSADFEPDEKARMLEQQQSRGGQPNKILSQSGGGWNNYGERKIDQRSLRMRAYDGEPPELLRFIPLDGDAIDVNYSYAPLSGYQDATGRPGNTLTVNFKLTQESAASLREVLHRDPSFIDDVIERQVAAIGVDTESDTWRSLLKPKREISAGEDGPLVLEDTDGTLHFGNNLHDKDGVYKTTAREVLSYGAEQRSILEAGALETSAVEAQDNYELPLDSEAQPSHSWEQKVADSLEFIEEDISILRAQGSNWEDVLAQLQVERASAEAQLQDPKLDDEGRNNVEAALTAHDKAVVMVQEHQTKDRKTAALVGEIEQLYQTDTENVDRVGQTLVVDGTTYVIESSYTLQDANRTPWYVLRGPNGEERQIKAV